LARRTDTGELGTTDASEANEANEGTKGEVTGTVLGIERQ